MAFFLVDGDDSMEIEGRGRLDRAAARRMVIREMIIMRDMGYTYREIGLKYRCSRVWVSKLIRGAPSHVRERLREVGLV